MIRMLEFTYANDEGEAIAKCAVALNRVYSFETVIKNGREITVILMDDEVSFQALETVSALVRQANSPAEKE